MWWVYKKVPQKPRCCVPSLPQPPWPPPAASGSPSPVDPCFQKSTRRGLVTWYADNSGIVARSGASSSESPSESRSPFLQVVETCDSKTSHPISTFMDPCESSKLLVQPRQLVLVVESFTSQLLHVIYHADTRRAGGRPVQTNVYEYYTNHICERPLCRPPPTFWTAHGESPNGRKDPETLRSCLANVDFGL